MNKNQFNSNLKPSLIEALRETYKQSLYALCKVLLEFKDVNLDTHGDIIKLLESPGKRKLICVPRGTLKSTIACVAYVIWILIKNPNARILIDSELYTKSSNFIREIKSHMKTQKFIDLFGNLEGDVWAQGEIVVNTRTKSFKEASVTAGGIGTQKTGQHFDYIIADDLNSPTNSNSIENAQKVIEHYRYNISILEPEGTYIIIGTRYAENDVIGFILENEEHNYSEAG